MTACVNRKHTKKVAAVVTASLVGALSLGAAPVAAMAETGIDLQFTDAATAFSNGTANYTLRHGLTDVQTGTSATTANTTFQKNVPVTIDVTSVTLVTGDSTPVDVTVDGDDYEIAYYQRDEKGNPTGSEITGDVTEVGEYVAVLTAVDGQYAGGEINIPFDIDAINIDGIVMSGEINSVYDATEKDVDFELNGVELVEGVDYTVEYVETGDDTSAATELKDAGTYAAVVTGMGGYTGSVTLQTLIQIHQLDLNAVYVEDIYTSDANEPTAPDAIWINGHRYAEGSEILSEIKADLTNGTDVYFDNQDYSYTAVAKSASDDNFVAGSSKQFTVHKVAKGVTFTYDGESWPTSYESLNSDSSTKWDSSKVKATAADGTVVPVTKYLVYNDQGVEVDSSINWSITPGTYTIVYYAIDGNNYGGKTAVELTVYDEAINADAQVFASYRGEIVTSIDTVYDGNDVTAGITVKVQDSNKNDVTSDCEVSFYNEDGIKVNKIVDAGTYTMKVTSSTYKLSGTTEMTINVAKKDLSEVKSGAVTTASFDRFGDEVSYLPFNEDGYDLSELDLQYFDAESDMWGQLDLQTTVKASILDADGNEVKKVTDEGVYTIHFEARNDDAANNYVIPADLTVTCIKGSHLLFADVEYTDYFADPVAAVASNQIMNGYSGTKLFGSEDQLTRGQVACILFNLTDYNNIGDETDYKYTEDEGYITGFSDVNGKEYYGKAIAWAKQAGVVNGYGDGTFKPDQAVTREEFAAMLANYASKYDQSYSEADTSVLDQFDDAASVSDWATEVVAWAVENGVMGNGGFLAAQSDIIRADAACMVYNYALAE